MTNIRYTNRRPTAFIAVLLVAAGLIQLGAQTKPKNIDFWVLSAYDYNPREPYEPSPLRTPNSIPPAIRALEGQKVTIVGNTMALDYSSGLMSEFILQASVDACEFGATPRINEWIYVRMTSGQKTRVSTAMEAEITGTFRILEEVEDGRVVGLYRIEADSVR